MTLHLLFLFAGLSLLAIGGANPLLPEMHRLLVEERRWIGEHDFAQLFALAQAAPGPNILSASAMGWAVAGVPGLLAATAGILGPAALLAYVAGGLTDRFRHAWWLKPAQFGLVPVAVGLIAASGLLMAEAAALRHWWGMPVFLASALVLWRTDHSPLWVLAGGALAGLLLTRV